MSLIKGQSVHKYIRSNNIGTMIHPSFLITKMTLSKMMGNKIPISFNMRKTNRIKIRPKKKECPSIASKSEKKDSSRRETRDNHGQEDGLSLGYIRRPPGLQSLHFEMITLPLWSRATTPKPAQPSSLREASILIFIKPDDGSTPLVRTRESFPLRSNINLLGVGIKFLGLPMRALGHHFHGSSLVFKDIFVSFVPRVPSKSVASLHHFTLQC